MPKIVVDKKNNRPPSIGCAQCTATKLQINQLYTDMKMEYCVRIKDITSMVIPQEALQCKKFKYRGVEPQQLEIKLK